MPNVPINFNKNKFQFISCQFIIDFSLTNKMYFKCAGHIPQIKK